MGIEFLTFESYVNLYLGDKGGCHVLAVNSSLFPSIKCEVESLGDGERCCLSLKKLVSQVGVPGLVLQSVYSGFILKEGCIE